MPFHLEHTYAESLPGFFVDCPPAGVSNPSLLKLNRSLAQELGLDLDQLTGELSEKVFSGNQLPPDARPIAQAYAGHQFGSFVPQLGDGRALLIGECIDGTGQRRDIALKGSGRTPFSRGGDGKAAVGPVLREYLIGEAMHALGIPTTRALAAVATGEPVMREGPLPGAVLTRVAGSHVRVGTFQFFAARQQIDQIKQLADYVIQRHYPDLQELPDRYLALLHRVSDQQAALIAKWMLVGFIHGVMNTDNMAISGETIDYGPCAFMETYDPATVFSSIDHAGRYAFGNQPAIGLWNLTRFAETLVPVIDGNDIDHAVERATRVLETFYPTFQRNWYDGARQKLGIVPADKSLESDPTVALIDDWYKHLEDSAVDFTLAWRRLADAVDGSESPLTSLFNEPDALADWIARWKQLLLEDPPKELARRLRELNPVYIPRNHLVEEALAAASDEGDLQPFNDLLQVLQHPFEERSEWSRYAEPAPKDYTKCYQTFCGT
ncbi:MAG: YdiU family protein [Planctomycetota bacterium]